MNKTQVKGTLDEVMGSVKHKAGELTGNKTLQVKGIVQQAEGRIENTFGKAEEAVGNIVKDAKVHMNAHVKHAAKSSSAPAYVSTTRTAPNAKPAIRTV
jgi:uncharacterized protein YjbJ (UPF0337 family)